MSTTSSLTSSSSSSSSSRTTSSLTSSTRLSTTTATTTASTSAASITGVAAGSSGTFVAITTFSPGVSTIGASTSSNPTFVFLNATASSTSSTASNVFSSFATPTIGTAGAAGAGSGLNSSKAPFMLMQTLGGVPSKTPDMGASALGLVLFFLTMLICLVFFRKSRGRSRAFFMFLALAAFCLIRFITMALRMGWADNRSNVNLALAAGIFAAAGTLILYVINGILTFRIVKDQHRRLIGSVRLLVITRTLLVGIVLTLILMIVAVVQSAYTTKASTRRVDREMQLYGVTFFAVIAGLPLVVLLLSHFTANRVPSLSKVGPSRHRRRVTIVVLASLLLSLRACWICGATWQTPTPLSQPLQWYFNKPAFYLIALLPELLVVLIFCFMRIDNYFWLGIDGRFDDPSSTISSPEPLVTPLPAPRNPSLEPKIAWTPPPISRDVEQGYDYNSYGGIGPRQRYPAGINTMSPVDEERGYASNSSKNMSQKTSRESLSGQSYQYAATVTGDDNMDYPMPPKFSKRATNGTLSIISSFPEAGPGGPKSGYGRGSLAMDPSTGLYHFVSAPLVPMFSPAAMGAGGDVHSSMFFGESPFADPTGAFNSGRQSRASNAPTLLNGSQQSVFGGYFPAQSQMSFQPLPFQPAPLNYATPLVPTALTTSNTGSSASSSSSATVGLPDPNSAAPPVPASMGNNTLPPSLQAPTPSPPQMPALHRRPSPPNPLQSHPGPGAQQQYRPGSIYQRRRTSSMISAANNRNNTNPGDGPSARISRMISNSQPPTLAALRLQDTQYNKSSRYHHHSSNGNGIGKSRALSSHMSMASTRSTGLDSLVNMVQSHANSSERLEQQSLFQSQRERPGMPGRESVLPLNVVPRKQLSSSNTATSAITTATSAAANAGVVGAMIPPPPPLPQLPPQAALSKPPLLRVSKSFEGGLTGTERPSTLSAGAKEFWGQTK